MWDCIDNILEFYLHKEKSILSNKLIFSFLRSFQRCTTNGIEFRWEGLKQKLSPELEHVAPITRKWQSDLIYLLSFRDFEVKCASFLTGNSQKFHYYLNVDRCAYGGSLKLSANVKGISNRKQVCGPIIFAVNSNCTAVYYYQDAPNAGWKRYQSVRYYPELQRRLKCKFKWHSMHVFLGMHTLACRAPILFAVGVLVACCQD